jgi:hypothetical protein
VSNRTTVQTLLLALGTLILVAGFAGVVIGFARFAIGDPNEEGNSSMLLFAAGGFAAVVGFGIISFTRASILTRNGGYARVTIEQGAAPTGGRFCPACGRATSSVARFCDSCGSPVG